MGVNRTTGGARSGLAFGSWLALATTAVPAAPATPAVTAGAAGAADPAGAAVTEVTEGTEGTEGARAERLPLADGSWIETRGPVRVERGRVIYRSPQGNLRSLPVGEVALDGPPARASRGAPVREYPSGAPILFAPAPPPPPRALPRRPDAPPVPPRCWLANARPGDPPELVCGDAPRGRPAVAPAPSGSAGGAQRPSRFSGS